MLTAIKANVSPLNQKASDELDSKMYFFDGLFPKITFNLIYQNIILLLLAALKASPSV
jgi:hypothetical protein